MQNTKTAQISKDEFNKYKDILSKLDWKNEKAPNEYVVWRMKSYLGSTAMLYTSGKLVLQGNEDFSNIFEVASRDEKLIPHLGVDEVGKGDYFGPLVVVSCFVNSDNLEIFKSKFSKE